MKKALQQISGRGFSNLQLGFTQPERGSTPKISQKRRYRLGGFEASFSARTTAGLPYGPSFNWSLRDGFQIGVDFMFQSFSTLSGLFFRFPMFNSEDMMKGAGIFHQP